MTDNPLFRKVALDRLSSPEQLDQLMQVTNPKGWIALAALGALIVAALVWGIAGSIPEKVFGQGILIKSGGIREISAVSSGQITTINVQETEVVRAGQIVARISQPALLEKIRDARSRVSELEAKFRTTREFSARDIELQTQIMEKQRRNLQETNRDLTKQLSWLLERAKSQEELLSKGLITKQTLQQTLAAIDSNQEQTAKNWTQIHQIDLQEAEIKNQRQQEVIAARNDLEAAQRQYEALQYQQEIDSRVMSPYSGTVVELVRNPGASVTAGTPIMSLELSGDEVGDLVALVYLSAGDGKKISRGMAIQISPSTVKQEEYGFIRGLVVSIGDYPVSSAAMQSVLGNQDLVRKLSEGGAPIGLYAELLPDPSTPSGYLWSSSKGPPHKIHQGTLCYASIVTREQPPISLAIPLIKKYLLGVGQERPG